MIKTDLDTLARKAGGRFRLCSVIIKRARIKLLSQASQADPKLNSEIVHETIKEFEDGKIELLEAPDPKLEPGDK